MTRRQFAQTLGAVTAGSYNRIMGANNRIGFGIIGVGRKGGRGTSLLEKCCLKSKEIDVRAVCDVYVPFMERATNIVRKKTKRLVPQFVDFRHILDLKEIEAVVIATPDHWHALQTIMACQAGKDVYLEKPISHLPFEEPPMIKAMQEHKRIVQVGTQQQSNEVFTDAVRIVRSGVLGKINRTNCWIYWSPDLNTEPKDSAGFNWDLWLGPAPYVEYDPARAVFTWRYFFDYGGGKLTDWGPHFFTEILAATGYTRPQTVTACGHTWHKDHRDTPDDLSVTYHFGDFTCVFDHAPWGDKEKLNHGIEFIGQNGTLKIDRENGYRVIGEDVRPPEVEGRTIPLVNKWPDRSDSRRHMENFVECIKTRNKPVSSLENHRATWMAHLGNIAYKSKQTVYVDPETGGIAPAWLHHYTRREYRKPWQL